MSTAELNKLIRTMTHRDQFAGVLNQTSLLNKGVEIGVHRGEYSLRLRSEWRGKMMYGVDRYTPIKGWVDTKEECEVIHVSTKAMLEANGNYELIRDESIRAVNMFGVESLDWVYIDASHDYDSVSLDLHFWYQKIRRGGIIAGHDYMLPGESRKLTTWSTDVFEAVNEAICARNIPWDNLHTTDCTSFWIVKP